MVTTAALATGRRDRTRLMDTRDSHPPSQIFRPVAALRGACRVPGDKSISHRALLFASLAPGPTSIQGLGTGQDVLATARALQALGVPVGLSGTAAIVHGLPLAQWQSPVDPIDCGNSGTTLRLLAGLLAAAPGMRAILTGDASLQRRPMRRVVEPLQAMAACISLDLHGTPPLTIEGTLLHGAHHHLAVASAQVKTALLLAGLSGQGDTVVHEPLPSRDHTERLLAIAGVPLHREHLSLRVTGRGPWACPLPPLDTLRIPGDPSSAAFLLVAALLHVDAEVRVHDVCCNPLRLGWVRALQRMGADMTLEDQRLAEGEPVATLVARSSSLTCLELEPEEVPASVDEVPLLALASAAARGVSRLHGLAELRVKESDRLAATRRMLALLGVETEVLGDSLIVHGQGSARAWQPTGEPLTAGHDHRMAMAMAIAGIVGPVATRVQGPEAILSSFPEFQTTLANLARRP
jgi:3-phosphoshikimate 1-carboxyvinyltransferase